MDKPELSSKEVFLAAAPGMFLSIIILLVFYLVHPNLFLILAGILGWVLVARVWGARRSGWVVRGWAVSLLSQCVWSAVFILVLVLLQGWLGRYGFWGLLLICCVLAAYRIWKSWGVYTWALRSSFKAIRGYEPGERGRRF